VPMYEYECRECGSRFEKLVFRQGEKVACLQCGSSDLNQLLSVFAVAGGTETASIEPGPCGSCGAATRGSCGMN